MAKPTCQCKKHAECEECPEWIFTFADLVMLMMGFFVILWVLKPSPGKNTSAQDNEELVKMAAAIREAFGYIANPQSNDPVDLYMMHHHVAQVPMAGPGEKGMSRLTQKGADGNDSEVTDIRPGDQATDGGKLLFDKGSAELSASAQDALNQVAVIIIGHRNVTMIKGHVAPDEIPEGSAPDTAMQLSIRRAQAVADYLISRGVKPVLLRVEGCSTFEPVRQRAYGADGEAINRRVEVEAVDKFVEDYQDKSQSTPEPMDNTPATAPQ